jgi:hypothetical protein
MRVWGGKPLFGHRGFLPNTCTLSGHISPTTSGDRENGNSGQRASWGGFGVYLDHIASFKREK